MEFTEMILIKLQVNKMVEQAVVATMIMDGTEFLDVTTVEDDKEDTNVVKAYDIEITSRNL